MAESTPSQSPIDDIKNKISNVSSERRWSMLCYIPVINLLTCTLTSVKMINSKLCLFHARQGYIIFALWVIATLIGFISSTLSLMLLGIVFTFYIAGIVVSYGGKEVVFPIIGNIAKKIPEYYVFKTLTGKIPEQESDNLLSTQQNTQTDLNKETLDKK